jgi:transaldolase
MAQPVEEMTVRQLHDHFHDFRRAYNENAMRVDEFLHFGATLHTLNEFISGYHQLLETIQARMLN